jgi:hypothetical protein
MMPELEAAATAIAAAYNRAVEATTPSGFFSGLFSAAAESITDTDKRASLKTARDQWNAWIAKAETASNATAANTLIRQAETIIELCNYVAGVNARVSLTRAVLETISDDPKVETLGEALATVPKQVAKKVGDILPENTALYVIGALFVALMLLVLFVRR